MSYQEKKVLVSLFTTIAVVGVYVLLVADPYFSGRFEQPDGLMLLGRYILAMIGGVVVATIVGQILLAVVTQIGRRDESLIEDERDRLIEQKSMTVATGVIGTGIVVSIGALATGVKIADVLHMIVLGMVLGCFVSELVKLRLYRRGV